MYVVAVASVEFVFGTSPVPPFVGFEIDTRLVSVVTVLGFVTVFLQTLCALALVIYAHKDTSFLEKAIAAMHSFRLISERSQQLLKAAGNWHLVVTTGGFILSAIEKELADGLIVETAATCFGVAAISEVVVATVELRSTLKSLIVALGSGFFATSVGQPSESVCSVFEPITETSGARCELYHNAKPTTQSSTKERLMTRIFLFTRQ